MGTACPRARGIFSQDPDLFPSVSPSFPYLSNSSRPDTFPARQNHRLSALGCDHEIQRIIALQGLGARGFGSDGAAASVGAEDSLATGASYCTPSPVSVSHMKTLGETVLAWGDIPQNERKCLKGPRYERPQFSDWPCSEGVRTPGGPPPLSDAPTPSLGLFCALGPPLGWPYKCIYIYIYTYTYIHIHIHIHIHIYIYIYT